MPRLSGWRQSLGFCQALTDFCVQLAAFTPEHASSEVRHAGRVQLHLVGMFRVRVRDVPDTSHAPCGAGAAACGGWM